MAETESWAAKRSRWKDGFHARLAGLANPASGFVSQPEPRTIGSFSRGRQLTDGKFLFAGFLVEAENGAMWDLPMPDRRFEAALHGFTWLDDLAACGDALAQKRAFDWTHDWIARYGRGTGRGWTADLTGRRLIRMISNAVMLLNGAETARSDAFFRALGRQTVFLKRRWRGAPVGLPRFEALTGLVYGALSLEGLERFVGAASRALGRECAEVIGADGGVPTRSPEDLLEVFTLLNWAATALSEAGRMPAPGHYEAIERIAPVLRRLRHADGGLARFHGGGRGLEGRLEHALATSGVRAAGTDGLAMGFARLSEGRTTVILDAAVPPVGEPSDNAHASTLAFEMTSGRRPVIVNCGSGATFGESWHRAGRATPSHSTLGIDGYSSSRLGPGRLWSGRRVELLVEAPSTVKFTLREGATGPHVIASHDGYLATHGLTHVRTLELSRDGRSLDGSDVLSPQGQAAERRFNLAFDRTKLEGIPISARFHLHPDADPRIDLGGQAVSIALKSGEIWVFRFSGPARLGLEPSVYLEKSALTPRATQQIVLHAAAMEFTTRLDWSFAKAQDTPTYLRDFETDEADDELEVSG
ncbi:MAG: heparinase II/III family protein [Paracoccaceae bacterium]|nr:heparinase II/III family protein [Paracoccaceae bacterium]